MKNKFFLFIFTLICSVFAYTQNVPSKRVARGYFRYGNYQQSLIEFKKLREKDSTSVEYNHKIGLCYLYSNIDKTRAVKYLEWVVNQRIYNTQALYDLGHAYMRAYLFDDAIEAFEKYIKLIRTDNNYIPASRKIEMCNNAKELIESPINVSFENIKIFNSDAPDFNPYVTSDENLLIFNTKREGNVGRLLDYDGFYTADIMFSNNVNGKWGEPKRFPNTINSPVVEEIVGLSPDGSHMFIYMENQIATGDIYLSMEQKRGYGRPEPLGQNINTKSIQTSACISPNKRILFFSAILGDSYGGYDIYYSRKLPTGEWGGVVNAGTVINTLYDEEFFYIAPDGNTFYFASAGHNSMGGYDIFKSDWNNETMEFSKPKNIGYPINTPDDNYTISFTKSDRYAYIAAKRDDSSGDLDIYKVIFNDVEPPMVLIEGYVLNPYLQTVFYAHRNKYNEKVSLFAYLDSLKFRPNSKRDSLRIIRNNPYIFDKLIELDDIKNEKLNVEIIVHNVRTKELAGKYRPNPNTGKYIVILPPGEYNFVYYASGYLPKTKDIIIPEHESFSFSEDLNVVMEIE